MPPSLCLALEIVPELALEPDWTCFNFEAAKRAVGPLGADVRTCAEAGASSGAVVETAVELALFWWLALMLALELAVTLELGWASALKLVLD